MSTDAGFDQPAFCTKTLEGLILLTKYFVCNVFFVCILLALCSIIFHETYTFCPSR